MSRDARLIAAILIFLTNDFGFIWLDQIHFRQPYLWFYGFDYACRIAALALVWPEIRPLTYRRTIFDWQFERPWFLGDFLLIFLLTIVVLFLNRGFFGWLPVNPLVGYPAIPFRALRVFDLTIGLMLVAISEELIFRRLLIDRIDQIFRRPTVIIVTASAIFAAIHWSSGWSNSMNAFAIGVVFSIFYRGTGRVAPLILFHYLYNYLMFA